jgi:hypothetical protein
MLLTRSDFDFRHQTASLKLYAVLVKWKERDNAQVDRGGKEGKSRLCTDGFSSDPPVPANVRSWFLAS